MRCHRLWHWLYRVGDLLAIRRKYWSWYSSITTVQLMARSRSGILLTGLGGCGPVAGMAPVSPYLRWEGEVVSTTKLPDSATLGALTVGSVRQNTITRRGSYSASPYMYYYTSRIEILMTYTLLPAAIRSKRG